MYTVKLTFNYDWPIFRQTPAFSMKWGDYEFVIDKNLEECDFWVVYSNYKLTKEQCRCNKNNILFFPAECYQTSPRFSEDFLNQFGKVITVQRELTGHNVVYWQNANPWFVEKSYDELINMSIPPKNKLISIVSSNKVTTQGHKRRLDFAYAVKAHFGEQVDLFGRGIADFEKKWDVLAPYKYHIAIENDFCSDWVTEKFFDPILTFTYPFYYGCPNMLQYMPEGSYTPIDIYDTKSSIKKIEDELSSNNALNHFLQKSQIFREAALNKHQFFPMLVSFFQEMDSTHEKELNTILPENISPPKPMSIFERIKRIIK